MKDIQIKLSLIDLVTVIDVHIWKKVNEHGIAVIRGIIAEEDETILFENAQKRSRKPCNGGHAKAGAGNSGRKTHVYESG